MLALVKINPSEHLQTLNISAKLFTAQHTNVCFPRLVKRLRNQHKKLQHEVIAEVGHLFPMEKPKMTADLITKTIHEWENSNLTNLSKRVNIEKPTE